MPELILTEDQAKILAQTPGPMAVRDPNGQLIGYIEPMLTPETIAELKRRAASAGPWYTGAQVQARLEALEEEWARTGGFDEAHLRDLMERLNAADPGHMRALGQGK